MDDRRRDHFLLPLLRFRPVRPFSQQKMGSNYRWQNRLVRARNRESNRTVVLLLLRRRRAVSFPERDETAREWRRCSCVVVVCGALRAPSDRLADAKDVREDEFPGRW